MMSEAQLIKSGADTPVNAWLTLAHAAGWLISRRPLSRRPFRPCWVRSFRVTSRSEVSCSSQPWKPSPPLLWANVSRAEPSLVAVPRVPSSRIPWSRPLVVLGLPSSWELHYLRGCGQARRQPRVPRPVSEAVSCGPHTSPPSLVSLLPLGGQRHFILFCKPTGVSLLKGGTGIGAQKPVERAARYIKGCCQFGVFGHVLACWWDSVLSSGSQSMFPGNILHQLHQYHLGAC